MQKLIESLTKVERKVLPLIQANISYQDLLKKSKLQDVELTKALSELENKKLITLKKTHEEIIQLDENGILYEKKGFPEKRLLEAIKSKSLTLEEIKAKADLDKNELSISLGLLKRKNAILLGKDIKITDEGKKLLEKESHEEKLLKKLPLELSKLSPEEQHAFKELNSRKQIIKTSLEKTITTSPTNLGNQLKRKNLNIELIENITTQIIKTSSWKNKSFRRYDVNAISGKNYPGKTHFVNQSIRYVKRVWSELGFKEMTGNKIQTSFWNFDSLFTAQDHPARDLQDTFFIKSPKKGKLPNQSIVSKVKQSHVSGYNTGSLGWQYSWNPEDAKLNVLRTHTTCLSAQTLASLDIKKDIPAKFFSVGKCFRNETLDWKHLFEFDQSEGIVIDENANFKHLLGYLKEFFKKMGFPQARFRPAYFPYTEPSVEIDVFHPIKKEWIELGGAGMFRPEVVVPLLGKDIPVLAWGLGLGRLLSDYYSIRDIRELYKNDLKQLRTIKPWLK